MTSPEPVTATNSGFQLKKLHLFQHQVDHLIQILLTRIPNTYSYIVGIREGGLHVSQPLATALQLPHETVRISHYSNSVFEDDGFTYRPNGLLVDDLIDQGKTILDFFDRFGNLDTAVLLWNETAPIRPTYFAGTKPDSWIVFPWEKNANQRDTRWMANSTCP